MVNVNEQEMRSYLLGGLMPERGTELENLARTDENLREEFLALEEELVEQYLAGVLTEAESQSFEAQILTTERGQQQLHFAQLFERYRNSNPAVEPHSAPASNHPPNPTSSPLFATFYRNPTFAVLSIFVAGLLIALVGWMLVAPSRGTSIAEDRLHQKPVVLVGDSTRSGGRINQLSAPAKNGEVKLELELIKSDFTKYRMKLFRANDVNKEIDAQEELTTETRDTHYFVPVVVTSEKLTPGEYHLKLCGVLESGEPSTIDNYSFRVTDADVQLDQQDRFAR
jgi:hypothetical protein